MFKFYNRFFGNSSHSIEYCTLLNACVFDISCGVIIDDPLILKVIVSPKLIVYIGAFWSIWEPVEFFLILKFETAMWPFKTRV